MTQSPLGSNAAGSPDRNSRVLRILKLDVTDPYNAFVTGQFVFLMSDRTVYTAPGQPTINQRDLKLSAMSWVGPNKLLLLERSDEVGRGGVRLILVDLEGATNIEGIAAAETLAPEDVNNTLSSLNITPVESEVVFEEYQYQKARKFWTYKLEGMAIHNANTVEIINDNDFGIADVIDAPTNLWTLRLADQLPLGK
jgi:phytase-like protein